MIIRWIERRPARNGTARSSREATFLRLPRLRPWRSRGGGVKLKWGPLFASNNGTNCDYLIIPWSGDVGTRTLAFI